MRWKRGIDVRLLTGKASEAGRNYSCSIGPYKATWNPAERSGYRIFYGSPNSSANSHYSEDPKINANHLRNTNFRDLADHKRTELMKRHLHIPPSCTRGLDNYLHFGTEPTDSDLLICPKSKFGCSFAFALELLPVIICEGRQRNALKSSFSDSDTSLGQKATCLSPEYPRWRNMHAFTFLSFFFKLPLYRL